jgi:hypothetical protein
MTNNEPVGYYAGLADDQSATQLLPPAAPPPGPQDQPQPEPGPQAAPPKGEAKNDMLAWAALIGGFIMWPLGILFGHVSNRAAKREHRRRSMLAVVGLVLSYLGMSIVSVFVIAGVAGSASAPTAAAPAPSHSAPVTPAESATASGYLTAKGYTPVMHWSHDQWQKENKGAAAYDPFIAQGADVVAAGTKAGESGQIAVKVTEDSITHMSETGGLVEVISAMNAKGANAKLVGHYLVFTFDLPASGDAGSAASNPGSSSQAPAPAKAASTVLLDRSGYADETSAPFHVTAGSTLKITYSFWGNEDSNFIADLEGSDYSNMMSIANTIGTSGGKTTYAYPDSDGQVHLSLTATGHWHVKVEQVASA